MDSKFRIPLAILSVLVFLFLCWYFITIVAYLLIAGVLSVVARPIVKRLNQIKIKQFQMPPALSAILTIILFYLVVTGFIAVLVPIVADEAKNIRSIDFKKITESLKEPIDKVEVFINRYHILGEEEQELKEVIAEKLTTFFNATNISNIVNSIFSVLGNALIAIVSITFIVFFFLKESQLFKNIIYTLTPTGFEDHMKSMLAHTKELLTRYFVGVIIQITLIATFVTSGLSLVGIGDADISFKLALLIGMFAGFINIIPYVGPFIGASFGLIMVISSNLDLEFYNGMLPLMGWTLLVFGVSQSLDNFIFQPLIFSNSVRAHPLEIFVVILASASIAGVAGMIVAIPTYTILRIVAREFFSEYKLVRGLTANI